MAEASKSVSIEAAAKAITWADPKYLTNVMFVSQDPKISEQIKRYVNYEYTSGKTPHWIWKWTGLFDPFRSKPNIADLPETSWGKHRGAGRDNIPRDRGHHQKYAHSREDNDLKTALALSRKESTRNVKHRNKERPSITDHSETPRGKYREGGRGNRTRSQGHHQIYAHKDEDDDLKKALDLSRKESTPNEDGQFNSALESIPNGGGGDAAAAVADDGDDDDDDCQEEKEYPAAVAVAAAADNNNETLSRDPQHADNTLVCPICLNTITDPKQLDKCRHIFCKDCIDRSFKEFKAVCPSCNMVYGILTGDQPDGSTMDESFTTTSLPGYEGHGTITIEYHVPNGVQNAGHPHPGRPYKGTRRRAFLPDNAEGKEVLSLLRKAFDRKLTFTIGCSTTTGKENVATWNDIHHKTNIHGGPTGFGYPDPSYLTRVTDELASKGVTAKD